MRNPLRKHRDSYLEALAAEPLFHDVPRHLMTAVARAVDRLDLDAGDVVRCDSARETIVIADGHVLLTDADSVPLGIIGPGSVVAGSTVRSALEPHRITALSTVRAFVIARRELRAVTAIAPGMAAAVAYAEESSRFVSPARATPTSVGVEPGSA